MSNDRYVKKADGKMAGSRPGVRGADAPTSQPGSEVGAPPDVGDGPQQQRRLGKTGEGASTEMLTSLGSPDYTTWTPTDVDTELARLHGKEFDALMRLGRAIDHLHRQADDRRGFSGRPTMSNDEAFAKVTAQAESGEPAWKAREAERALADVAEHRQRIADLRDLMRPLNDEYVRRGRWTRAFLADTNGSGHVHKSMSCSTCNKDGKSTRFAWMTDYSGKDETEIVEAAGERACTVCYPSAPVETLSRPTQMFSDDERAAAQARAERAAAKLVRDAERKAKAPTVSGEPLTVSYNWEAAAGTRTRTETFKTETAARNWYVQEKAWRGDGTRDENYQEAYTAIEVALAEKHGVTVEEERAALQAKVAAKIRRDARG